MNKYWNCLGGKGVALFMFNSINGLDIYALIKSIGVCFFPLKKGQFLIPIWEIETGYTQDFLTLVFTATSDVRLLDFHILPIEELNPKYGISQQISLKPNFIMTR